MKITDLLEDGRIVKGVNTTVDVDTNEIPRQAEKFGNKVSKDGVPPTLSSKVKGKSTNVLFNLGLTEGIILRLERDKHIDVLHLMDTKEKHRVEIRGKKGYESGNYDPQDKLHQVLDSVGKAANISELINGETVSINPNHPQGTRAIRTARDVLQTEQKFTPMELALMEGGHSIEEPKKSTSIIKTLEDAERAGRIATTQAEPRNLPIPVEIADFALTKAPSLRQFVVYNSTYGIIGIKTRDGEQIRQLQASLNRAGYDLEVDGLSGPNTQAAIIDVFYKIAETHGVGLTENFADGKKNESALKEQPWNNQSDTGSLSSKIFQPGDFISNQGDPIWGLWLPLSSGILHKLTPKKQRVTAFHLTGVQNIDNMINLQGKKKSISSFFYMHHSHYDRGVRGGGGVIFELDANLLGAFEQDIMSDPDKSGMRWITLEYLVRAAYEHGEPLVKLYSEMAGLLKTLLKKYAPDVTFDSDIDAGNKWTEFGKSLAAAKDGKTQNLVIKDYIDGTYAIMLKHAEHVRKALFYYMDNPGSTQDDWDEVVVNEFKIKTAHVLKNTAEDPQNLEKLKQLESKGIPVRVWDSPQELNDYVEKIGMSQKLEENFADGKKKGKSRPGRVKRAGASCNGSVTDLRKRAKNSSGEKARMYHWCANMKSGRKKKS